jgi:phosphoglycolate phosphatase-like HAD superfamily hydrolase
LRSAGIWESFDSNFAYFGDKSPSRFDLVSLSATSIQSRGDFEVIIVGDTPLDVLSAQGCGLRVIAVATGAYSATQLERLNPDLLISNWDSGLAALVEFVNFP